MSVTLNTNNIIISNNWTNFKSVVVNSKYLPIQYEDDGYTYTIFSFDSNIILYNTTIWKDEVPDGVINGGYSQIQNDIDKTDFETNFKPFANKPLTPNSAITLGYTTSSSTVLTVIRSTAYVEQTTNAQRSIVSSSSDDTSAGTGAQTVKIVYYDQTLLGPFTEIVSMNGTSPVNTVNNNICFIEKIEVMTVGSQLSNVGIITLNTAINGGGTTIGTIPAGDGITNWCHHYVGLHKTMSIVSVIGTIKGQHNGSLEIHRTIPTNSAIPELTVSPKFRIMSGSTDRLIFDVPIIVNGPAQVTVYGRSDGSSGTLDWSVGMGYYEV